MRRYFSTGYHATAGGGPMQTETMPVAEARRPIPSRSTAPTSSSSSSATPSRRPTTTARPSAIELGRLPRPRDRHPRPGQLPPPARTRSAWSSPPRSPPTTRSPTTSSGTATASATSPSGWTTRARPSRCAVERGAKPAAEPTVLRDDDGEVVIAGDPHLRRHDPQPGRAAELSGRVPARLPAGAEPLQAGPGRAAARGPLRRATSSWAG